MEQAPATPPAPADGTRAERPDSPASAAGGSGTQLDQLVRSFAVIVAAFYVIGFLTANSYRYLLGVSDFSLLRTRFIVTGVMVTAPLAFALAFGVYAAINTSLFERRAEGFN